MKKTKFTESQIMWETVIEDTNTQTFNLIATACYQVASRVLGASPFS